MGDHREGRFDFDESLRERAARGSVVNAAFSVGLSFLGFIKGFVVAAFLTTAEYGLWGILVISLGTLVWLKQTGVGDKFVQQGEDDQEAAFQKAFTVEALFTGAFTLLLLAAVPAIAWIYGQPDLVAPGLVLALSYPVSVLIAPVWVFHRGMKFVQQRALQAIDPVVAFVVTVALAVAGAGEWSLIVGFVSGTWASGLAALAASPYKVRFRWEPGALREYFAFSWPLVIGGASGLVIAQASMLVGEWSLGIGAVGAIALTSTVVQFTDRLDAILTGALYPAICAVRDRTDLLFESFVKSNRLALMWGVPFGVAIALFAADLVHFGIGDQWEEAIGLLQAFGLIAAVNHIGFNWDAFYRARAETRPIAVVAALMAIVFLATAIPLMIVADLEGFAIGMALMTLAGLAARAFYLARLFPGFEMLRHTARALAPSVPAVAAVLAARAVGPERSLALALGELALYVAVTLAATWAFERPLLREVLAYLRRRPFAAAA